MLGMVRLLRDVHRRDDAGTCAVYKPGGQVMGVADDPRSYALGSHYLMLRYPRKGSLAINSLLSGL